MLVFLFLIDFEFLILFFKPILQHLQFFLTQRAHQTFFYGELKVLKTFAAIEYLISQNVIVKFFIFQLYGQVFRIKIKKDWSIPHSFKIFGFDVFELKIQSLESTKTDYATQWLGTCIRLKVCHNNRAALRESAYKQSGRIFIG